MDGRIDRQTERQTDRHIHAHHSQPRRCLVCLHSLHSHHTPTPGKFCDHRDTCTDQGLRGGVEEEEEEEEEEVVTMEEKEVVMAEEEGEEEEGGGRRRISGCSCAHSSKSYFKRTLLNSNIKQCTLHNNRCPTHLVNL